MNSFRLHDPMWLLLLLPLLLFAYLAFRRSRRSTVVFSSTRILKDLPTTLRQRIRRLMPWIRIIGLGLVVAALARPQQGREEFRIRANGIEIEMCLDRSGSMRAMDFQLDGEAVNRLEIVKDVFRKFVAGEGGLSGRPDDKIGLIAFGGFAESICPQTLDHGTLIQLLDTVKIPSAIYDDAGRILNGQFLEEEQATAIGDSLALAVDRLKDSKAKSRVIILLSDGENTAGVVDPADAAAAAKEYGVKVYSIGVGSTGVAPFPSKDRFGREVLVRGEVNLDETTLRMIADETSGEYFNAKDSESLEQIYARIDELEKSKTDAQVFTDYRELYQWMILPGFCLVVLEVVLSSTWLRSLP